MLRKDVIVEDKELKWPIRDQQATTLDMQRQVLCHLLMFLMLHESNTKEMNIERH